MLERESWTTEEARAGALRATVRPITPELEVELLEDILRQHRDQGEAFPRIAVFLFGGSDPEALRKTIEALPEELDPCLEDVVLVPDSAPEGSLPPLRELAPGRQLELRIHRTPRTPGYGGARKSAFEYVLLRGFDFAVTLRGDGLHPPERLPLLLHAALAQPDSLVVATRLMHSGEAESPLPHRLAHTTATAIQNRLLGLRLGDYHSGFRVYSTRALRCIPFQLNADDRTFDMQTVIQCRALGAPIHEIGLPPTWKEYPSSPRGLFNVIRFTAAAFDYRLHQLHLTRRGQYFVDPAIHYTFKQSRTGSHMQIVEAIESGSRVLDLGCSHGLLAQPLREKDVRVTGVDVLGPRSPTEALEEFFERDLEQPLELPTGRVFDYVVCSDVIEHLRNRTELLRSVRRYLKPGGRLLISTPNVALWFYRLSLLVGRFEYGPRGVLDETHVHLYTRATFVRAVEKAGFRILRERVTALPFEVVFESTGRSRLVRGLAGAYHLLARIWPEMFAYQMLLEAEITTLDEESTGH